MHRLPPHVIGALVRCAALLTPLACAGCAFPEPFRVATFNIRYGTADDGENSWPNRRGLVIQTLREASSDVIGLQEALAFQLDELLEELDDYASVAAGRDDGLRRGEMTPILYQRRKFSLVAGGHFWLSDSPETPGSVGWDASLPRMASWARLRFRAHPLNEIVVINTHFDHRGERARLESARMIRRLADSMSGRPVLVLGDFNCAPGSPPYRELTGDTGNAAQLQDAYASLARPEIDAGTFHGFRGDRSGPRIDWVLASRRFVVQRCEALLGGVGGPYASDHFPVVATVKLVAVTASGMM